MTRTRTILRRWKRLREDNGTPMPPVAANDDTRPAPVELLAETSKPPRAA